MHEAFWPKYFFTDLIHNLNNVILEAGEVNTLNVKFVKVFNDTLYKHAPYRYASKKEQRSFNKAWLTKGILTSIPKRIPSTESSWLQTTQILLYNTKRT